jgi:hypothetical protein
LLTLIGAFQKIRLEGSGLILKNEKRNADSAGFNDGGEHLIVIAIGQEFLQIFQVRGYVSEIKLELCGGQFFDSLCAIGTGSCTIHNDFHFVSPYI